jgi:gamma-glutamyl-gamma-aminobutyrate hydrolase PuuD
MNIAIPIGFGRDSQYTINMAYPDYVSDAGYNPVLINPGNDVDIMANMLDGLLLPGGIDIDPIHYGDNNWGSYYCNPDKDKFERALLWAFMKAGRPVFGICRGHQLLAREYLYHAGDTLLRKKAQRRVDDVLEFEQHVGNHDCASGFNLWRNTAHHYVEARVDIIYGDTEYERDRIAVNSMHHQAVFASIDIDKIRKQSKIGPHFRALAWTTRGLDAEVEGVIVESFIIDGWSKAPLMGVQWHPEELRDIALLKTFFGETKAAKSKSGVAEK